MFKYTCHQPKLHACMSRESVCILMFVVPSGITAHPRLAATGWWDQPPVSGPARGRPVGQSRGRGTNILLDHFRVWLDHIP